MAKSNLPPAKEINECMQFLFSDAFRENPLLFVMWNFPWGQKGTPLEHFKGPREWQRRELQAIADHIKENKARIARGESPLVYKLCVASGRGIGKSALVSWLVLWFLSSHYGSTTIISANTDSQLSEKTFGEIGRWLALSLNSYFFEANQKSIKPAAWYEKLLREEMKIGTNYYYANGVLWNPEAPEAFAGAHSQIGMMVVFDESSQIPEPIWTVARGFFTENIPFRFWLNFSNPRSASGPFFDAFQDEDNGWNTRSINSLDVEGIDASELKEIIRKYGADSDEAKVEVYGLFPSHGDKQFISRSIVEEACKREVTNYEKFEALVMGVDPARYGSDSTVIRFRQGRDARSIPPIEFKGLDNMAVVKEITQLVFQYNPDAIFIDSGGGAGIIDRLKELGYKPTEVIFGSISGEQHLYDHRTEMWAKLRDWLPTGMIDDHRKLKIDLTSPLKLLVGRESKEKLESKEEMRRRGVKSPDHADALALTFHCQVARKDLTLSRKGKSKRYRPESKGLLD